MGAQVEYFDLCGARIGGTKMANKRGLVISSPIEVDGTKVTFNGMNLDRQELKFALLFFDRLDFPAQGMVSHNLSPEEEFLQGLGILERTKIPLTGNWKGHDYVVAAFREAFFMREKAEPGLWTLGSGPNQLSFAPEQLEPGRGTLLRIYQAIPVPTADVALQDILEFKEKRSAELEALRYHLDRVYDRVRNAADGPLLLDSELTALQKAIVDHAKASTLWGQAMRLLSLDANFNFPSAAGAAAVSIQKGLPLLDSLQVGAVAGFSVGIGTSLKGLKGATSPYKYVTRYHKELWPGWKA
jgi:hypothetical protein